MDEFGVLNFDREQVVLGDRLTIDKGHDSFTLSELNDLDHLCERLKYLSE